MRFNMRTGLVAAATAATALIGLASPASADTTTTYSSDQCSASGNSRCMALFYNSQSGAIFASSCFLSNSDIASYAGYYSGNGVNGTNVVFVFDYHDLTTNVIGYCDASSGSGLPVKNNAAGGSNTLSGNTVRVYYNSGQAGPYQSFAPGEIKNLNSTLKNQNASQELV